MKNLQFIQTSPEELNELIQTGVKNQLEQLTKNLSKENAADEILTRKEVCNLLKINASTLWAWSKKGKLEAHYIGNRVYYKRSLIEENLKGLNHGK